MKLILMAFFMSVLMLMQPVMADDNITIPQPDNIYDLWNVSLSPYSRLLGPITWVILLAVVEIGVYTKTESAGAVVASLAVLSLVLSTIVHPYEWVFRIMAGLSFAVLLYWIAKK